MQSTSINHPKPQIDQLFWDGPQVEKLMWRNNIHSRWALSNRLGISRAVINSAFDSEWNGRATTYLIARLTSEFGVPMSAVVQEPALIAKRTNSSVRGQRK